MYAGGRRVPRIQLNTAFDVTEIPRQPRVAKPARYSMLALGDKQTQFDEENIDTSLYNLFNTCDVWDSRNILSNQGLADFTKRNALSGHLQRVGA